MRSSRRRAAAPGGLSPLSTHDTKRSEDVRARIDVLSEMSGEWAACAGSLGRTESAHQKVDVDGQLAPDANEEYLLYQTLIGTWPGEVSDEFRRRIREYMQKALAEGKVHTSWINPDAEYEAAVATFIDRILDPALSAEFLRRPGRVRRAGRVPRADQFAGPDARPLHGSRRS